MAYDAVRYFEKKRYAKENSNTILMFIVRISKYIAIIISKMKPIFSVTVWTEKQHFN
jgi:hypothetical protein